MGMALQGLLDRVREAVPRSVTFFQEVWAELRKVHWPSLKETYAATGVVIVICAIVALYLGAVDLVLSQFVQLVLR
jgi:preprotein translocase subunit SecE